MKTSRSMMLALFGLFAMSALLVACEDADPTAQSDWKITVFANPASVDLVADPTGTVNLRAQVIDKIGIPQKGVGVKFSASSGTLASGSAARITNENGEAFDVLTTQSDSSVTATSGTITSTAVPIEILAVDRPTADLVISPSTQSKTGKNVTFSSSDSSSPDDSATIDESQWEIYSDNPEPGVEYFFTSNGTTPVVKVFTQTQTFTNVRLRVRDSKNRWSEWVSDTGYKILANLPPKADVTPSSVTGTVSTGSGYACLVTLSAAASVDQDAADGGAIAAYEWFWGDGRSDRILTGSTVGTHTYLNPSQSSLPYTVTLRVWDNGNACPPIPNSTVSPTANCPTRAYADDTATVTCPAS